MNAILLFELLFAHLVADFWLQPQSWVLAKRAHPFMAWQMYVHALVVGMMASAVAWHCGWKSAAAIGGVILISHLAIDIAKVLIAKRCESKASHKLEFWLFLGDQLMHLAVIGGLCVWLKNTLSVLTFTKAVELCAFAICGSPVNVGLKLFLAALGFDQKSSERSNVHAGALIGILERWLILAFALIGKYEVIGLIVAAKSIIRFGDKEGPKAEYVLVGTLLSLTVALFAAYCVFISK